LDLTYVVQEGSLLITTLEGAKAMDRRLTGDMMSRERPLTEREQAILAALQEKISFDFHEAPLRDVVSLCERDPRIHVEFDIQALDGAGMNMAPPIAQIIYSAENIPLSEALAAALKPAGLTYVIRSETLLITTPAGRIIPGDVVTALVGGAEMRGEPTDGAPLVAALPQGAKIAVLQVKPPFFRGAVTVAGEQKQGWIRHYHVALPTPADIYVPLSSEERPDFASNRRD
jgi:hypothetical protein